jgi:hypothetical protein
MGDARGPSAFRLFVSVVMAMTLVGALVGGVTLVLHSGAAEPDPVVEFAIGSGPGVVVLLGLSDVGDRPFTEPVAVDLAIDPVRLALPPLNATAAESTSRRGSNADLLMAGVFGRSLVALRDAGYRMDVARLRDVGERMLGAEAAVSDLLDTDGDGFDDDRRFTVTALDGSAVCVTLGERRALATALSLAVDPIDDRPASGLTWTPFGSCGASGTSPLGSEVRVGTTPGTYGAVRSGDVCDVELLVRGLTDHAVVGQSWAVVASIDPEEIPEFVSSLTPVILLRDTLVTDHGFDNGRIHSTQVVLQRGTAVLIDRTGQPRVRCMSGSPLRRPQSMDEAVLVVGDPWRGFSLDGVVDVRSAEVTATRFVFVDIRTGHPLLRQAGDSGAMSALAGPVVSAFGG